MTSLVSHLLVLFQMSHLVPISIPAQAKQDPKCAAMVYKCTFECTKGMERTQADCEKDCGTLDQCEIPNTPMQAGVKGVPPGIAKCDEQLELDRAECEKITDDIKSVKCIQGALSKYRACKKPFQPGGKNPQGKPNLVKPVK